ncbi:hypothetical protein BC937DRAFT_89401 [Endogone sp. FLAS-F59071]|nr:hypothetical protein BC937DRAFT_89401 [Endogone sp. FLAS-F59071]|eukprot:RUS17866.1 hypothetical protein BC937DRAFT_89401 [Endogone sp. FLAS-F59071]
MADQPQNDLSAVADNADSAGTVDNPTSTIDTPTSTIDTAATIDAPTTTENPEEKARILKQVEFYFSDANLPLDRFMWELTKKNDAGWVAISTVVSFKRMHQFTNIPLIVEALRESPELLEVNKQGTMVRRKKPLVDKKDAQHRSIYAKGFPNETPELLEEIEQFFGQFGQVCAVRLRRDDNRVFKNSVFVEYAYISDANKVAEMKLKFRDTDLLIMSKAAYVEMKAEQYANIPESERPKSKKYVFNAFRVPQRDAPYHQREKSSAKHDTLIKVTGHGPETSREDIKRVLDGNVKWVSYNRGESVAIVQLSDSVTTETIERLNSNGKELNGGKAIFEVPTEEEAALFWKETEERMNQPREQKDHNRGGGANRRPGGRQRGGKSNHRGNDGPRGEKRKAEIPTVSTSGDGDKESRPIKFTKSQDNAEVDT